MIFSIKVDGSYLLSQERLWGNVYVGGVWSSEVGWQGQGIRNFILDMLSLRYG